MLKEGMFIQGRYEIVGKIGTGGMADVYKARDHKLNRFVAVKVLKAEFREDKEFKTKFRAEAQAAAGLAHPNIVNIYDVGEEKDINFIVMELVEGITLKEYIAKKGRLAVREATSIAIQVSQGLEAAHSNGIIHRDVKPQNIIISTDGKVKVTDFGIARAANSNTISTSVMGSVHYSSPEQARGGYSDAKSDIYSLGITLYEMLTGRVPFDGDTTVTIAIKHLQEEMKSPTVYVPDLPRSTVQIISKCTQKSPDRRYAKMADLIRDLKESLVTPNGDFVQIPVDQGAAGKTVVLSKDTINAIKEGYNTGRIQETYQPAEPAPAGGQDMYGGGNGYFGGNDYNTPPPAYGNGAYNGPAGQAAYGGPAPAGQSYGPYTYGVDSRAYGNRGYDYQEDTFDKGRMYDDDEEERGILSPKLEKIMIAGSIIIAVIIAFIFLGLVANALGIFRFSIPDFLNSWKNPAQTERTTDSPDRQQETQAGDTAADPGQTVQVETAPAAPASEADAEDVITIVDDGVMQVPSVAGYDYETAKEMLMQAGFYASRTDEESDTVEKGIVISQSMTGNADPGSTVTLYVSSGYAEDENAIWVCNATLEAPSTYTGQAVRLVLEQEGCPESVLLEGSSIVFPYDIYVQGAPNVTTGRVSLYTYNEVTGDYELLATYDGIGFDRAE